MHDRLTWCLAVSSTEEKGRCQQDQASQHVHRNATALTIFRGNATSSDWEGAAVNSGDAVIRQNPQARHLERILVALQARHDR